MRNSCKLIKLPAGRHSRLRQGGREGSADLQLRSNIACFYKAMVLACPLYPPQNKSSTAPLQSKDIHLFLAQSVCLHPAAAAFSSSEIPPRYGRQHKCQSMGMAVEETADAQQFQDRFKIPEHCSELCFIPSPSHSLPFKFNNRNTRRNILLYFLGKFVFL